MDAGGRNHTGIFPFSRYSVMSRWTSHDCVHFFSYKLRLLRTECDRVFGAQYHTNPALRPIFTVTMLMLMVAHRHLQSLRTQMNKYATSGAPYEGWQPDAIDEAGVPIFPVQGSPCFVSLGHKTHGQEMTSGFVSSRPTSQHEASFDPDRCTIL